MQARIRSIEKDRFIFFNKYYFAKDKIDYNMIREMQKGCEKRIVPKKERPRVYNELKVFLSVYN